MHSAPVAGTRPPPPPPFAPARNRARSPLWPRAAAALLRTLPTLHTHNIFDARLRPFDENVVYTAAADGTPGPADLQR